MTPSTTRSRHTAAPRLKSPLAVPGASTTDPSESLETPSRGTNTLTDRQATLAEFQGYLRTVNSRAGRPFEEKTITAYSDPVKNTFFREYYLKHGQGGTHTLQRNLIQLFGYLERERGWPSPYTDRLNRYAAVKGHPKET
jgi:integrase/recombinase XerD